MNTTVDTTVDMPYDMIPVDLKAALFGVCDVETQTTPVARKRKFPMKKVSKKLKLFNYDDVCAVCKTHVLNRGITYDTLACESVEQKKCQWCEAVVQTFDRVVTIFEELDALFDMQDENTILIMDLKDLGDEKVLVSYRKNKRLLK